MISHKRSVSKPAEKVELGDYLKCSYCEKQFSHNNFLNFHMECSHSHDSKQKSDLTLEKSLLENETTLVVENPQNIVEKTNPLIPEGQPKGQRRKVKLQERQFF